MKKFLKAAAVTVIAAVVGGSSLGLGLAAGLNIGRHPMFASAPSPTEEYAEEQAPFLFTEQEVETLPLEVRVSDITGVIRTLANSVVSINIDMRGMDRFAQPIYMPGSGSGIIFASDDDRVYIATNNHVVENAYRISISLDDENEIEAVFVGGDRDADLAVLSVARSDLDGKEYTLAVFGNSDELLVGDEVVAIGNPMGAGQTATRGIISAVNRQITIDGRTLNVLQTDAAINPGNSGGALANIHGEVIGINTAKAIAAHIEGMGYALPSNEAQIILEQLLIDGTTPRPHMGIIPRHVDENQRDLFSLPAVGVLVTGVAPGSAAEEAGLEEGDLIVGFNELVIETIPDLAEALADSEVGQTVVITLYRRGIQLMTIDVTLGDANAG